MVPSLLCVIFPQNTFCTYESFKRVTEDSCGCLEIHISVYNIKSSGLYRKMIAVEWSCYHWLNSTELIVSYSNNNRKVL